MYPSMVLGLSDHTPQHSTVLGAVALGASMIEKHFTDDNNREGPDHPFSMDPYAWREMVDRTRELEMALGGGIKVAEENELDAKVVQRRSLRAHKIIEAGNMIQEGDFVPLRPCPNDAIEPSEIHNIIGKKLRRTVPVGEYLRETDLY